MVLMCYVWDLDIESDWTKSESRDKIISGIN